MKEQNKTELHPALHYLSTHPHLNLSSIAREVGVDPSNFKKMVGGKVGIKEEVLGKLERVLGEYGYRKELTVDEWEIYEGDWVAVEMDGVINVGVLCMDDDYGNFYLDLSHNTASPTSLHIIPDQHKLLPLSLIRSKDEVKWIKVENLSSGFKGGVIGLDEFYKVRSGNIVDVADNWVYVEFKNNGHSFITNNSSKHRKPTHIIPLTHLLNLPKE